MFIYKLTCSETNKVYYGATKNTPKYRKARGHYKCACKDFINPKIETIEKCNSIEEMYKREKYYIQNNECVNVKCKIIDHKEYNRLRTEQYRLKYPERVKEQRQKQNKPIKCDICGKLTSKTHIARHKQTIYCQKIKKENENKILNNSNEHEQAEV